MVISCSQVLPGNTVREALPRCITLEAEPHSKWFPTGDWEPVIHILWCVTALFKRYSLNQDSSSRNTTAILWEENLHRNLPPLQ
ncbi:MAG: hypothetical protein SWZ49_05905 [Cyanobacteriota bacterium]|nr:hypothetical protein [Cyanobacteriota bacterium]